jgi:hypothetical protein
MPRVEDLFDVKQGLLTGLNDAFILSKEQLNALPKSEQKFFRPALFRNAISDGAMHNLYFVFFPYNKTGLIFPDEDDLKKRVPEYFAEYLLPRESELRARSGVDDNRVRWWSLSRYYPWVQRTDPRILTKYFGSVGDFVVDESASWVPLQGRAVQRSLLNLMEKMDLRPPSAAA